MDDAVEVSSEQKAEIANSMPRLLSLEELGYGE